MQVQMETVKSGKIMHPEGRSTVTERKTTEDNILTKDIYSKTYEDPRSNDTNYIRIESKKLSVLPSKPTNQNLHYVTYTSNTSRGSPQSENKTIN